MLIFCDYYWVVVFFVVVVVVAVVFLFFYSFVCRVVIRWGSLILRHTHRSRDVWNCGFDRQAHHSPCHLSTAPLETPAQTQVSNWFVSNCYLMPRNPITILGLFLPWDRVSLLFYWSIHLSHCQCNCGVCMFVCWRKRSTSKMCTSFCVV